MKYIYVSDEVGSPTIGGANLTSAALMFHRKDEVGYLHSDELLKFNGHRGPETWIIGNIATPKFFVVEAIKDLIEHHPFVKIEFDYGYCIARGRKIHGHGVFNKEPMCQCPVKGRGLYYDFYELIKSKFCHVFYMSEAQKKIHTEHLGFEDHLRRSVLSSCFLPYHLDKMKQLRLITEKNDRWMIVGYDGYMGTMKGTLGAEDIARSKMIKYNLVRTRTYDEMLEKMVTYKGLIFVPKMEDTCPRLTIEAKLLGLELEVNENVQHTTEEWWRKPIEEVESYLRSRPEYFWSVIDGLPF